MRDSGDGEHALLARAALLNLPEEESTVGKARLSVRARPGGIAPPYFHIQRKILLHAKQISGLRIMLSTSTRHSQRL
jgi:hypothetical protein